ncbi:ZYRO0G03982p [Zygosaccharomyces rouxii]|uniref:Actin cytoskeleton-regulatory complex protein PAN1 n=1 Tax=Zygosaccharomyces rouxii (strain ATCC 2623 / CBS 732 / NBRC 1130 / NCYC 568 / NRRL Y-229) TaxID=559307 RepID=C5DZF5_ZYGRC|nr:uncharacterized protein ZYRO0G03982g [Zygosaccharomyces rouxii]KAH9202239.1 hypothetical protein LQ764DRAFT_222402 [Zygosaccharomyces rouxii]CAR29239.1 ZYRO0G03982p [Zygosaccharomyces rouxii]
MYNPYQNTGYFQQQPQQQQQQQQQQHSFGQQNPQASGFGGMPGSLSSTPMNFPQLQAQQQPSRFGGANTAVNPTGMSNLMPQSQSSFGSQQNTGMMGMPGPSNTASATSNQGNFVNQPQQQHPQSTGYFQSNALPLQQPQLQSQPTGFQNPLLSNPTGGMQPLLPQSTGFYHPTGGMPQAPLEPLKPTATGLVNSFANGGLNHDIKIPARRLSFITSNDQAKFETLFRSIVPKGSNTISGEDCKKIFLKSGLQASELAKIWKLSDTTRAGELLFPEFALAMHLVNDVLQGDSIPYELDTKTKNEVGSFVDAINLSIARGDGDPGPKTPFDDLMMGGLKPQSTGFMPPTSFGMPLQGQVTGGGAGLLNPQRTGFMPQTSFGMPMQPTGGAQFNPMGNMGGNAGVGIQSTGFMPQTSFGAPLQSQLTGGAVQRQPTGGFQNNFMPNMQPQNTGGFAALQPQKIQPQATGSLLPQGTGGLRPQTTGSFQQQQQQQQQLGGFQPQPTGGFQPQPTDGFQPQLNGGLQPQGTGGFQQQGFGGGIQPQLTGGFQQPQPSGGFQQPQPTGGFQQPQPSGGFQQPQPSGGFQQPQPSGGFQQPQPSGGFQQPQPSGGFQQAQPSGGFQQPQPTGGLQPQSTGPLQPQGTGFGQQGGGVPPLQPQGTGSFNGNLPQQPNGGFQGVPPPQQQPQLTGGLMPQATGGASTAVPIQQTGLSTQSTGFLPPSGFNPTQPLSAQKTGFGNNEIYTQSSFSQDFNGQNLDDILPEEKSLFYKIFQTYDTDKRGILDASKAVEIFRKSGLNRGDLEHIWALCDINNTGQLNKQEFALGMHLVYRKLNGFQLPNRLPLNLIPSSTKILDDVKNQIKSSVGTEDRRSSTKTDALSYKNNDDEDVLPSFRNRRKVFGANAPPATTNQDASAPAASASASAASQQAKPNVSDLKRAINERRQRLDTEKARLQTTTSDDDLRFISSLKSQIGELPSISVVNDSVPADLKERYETLLVKLPNLFVQIDEIDTQIRNAKLQLFKMKNPFSISGSGPNGEITDEDRKKAKSKALLKSRMNALTGKPSGPIGSFEEEEVKYNEEIKKINAGCNSNKEIIGDIKSSIADIAASLESGLSGGSIHANPGDFEVWEFGTRLEPEVRDFVYSLRTKTSQREQGNSSTVSAEANYSQQNYSQPAAQDVSRQTYGNLPQSTSNGYSQQPVDNNSTPVTSSNSQSYNFTDPSGNYRSQATVNSYSYSSNGNRSDNYNSGGSNQTSRQPSYAGGTSHNQPSSNEVVNGDDGEDEEEKQLRDKLEMLKLKKKSEKEKRLADLRRQIEEAKADGDEEAEVAALQNVANQRSTSSISISQDPAPSAASPALNQGRDGHPNVNSSHPSYGSAPAAHAGVNATRSSTVMSASPVSSVASPQPSGQGGRNAFFKQTPSTSSSFDLRAAETQRRLQRGLDDDESEGWSDDDNANAQTASPPKEPVPSAPYQQAPTPVAPAPVAPAPVAPAPVAPSNEEPKPMAPSLPQVKDDGPPVPVAPPLPQVQHQGPPVPVAPPLPQMQSESKPFFAGPPPLMPNEDENGGHGHGHGHEEEKHYADENDDDDDSLSIPESVGSDEDNFEMAHSAPSNIPPPPPLP